MQEDRPVLSVTEVGEYLRHRSCERRFKLDNDSTLANSLPFANRLFNSIDPVLQESGRRREDEWEHSLKNDGLSDLTQYSQKTESDKATSWTIFAEALGDVQTGEMAFGREITVEDDFGAFHVKGRIDFVVLLWDEIGPKLRLVECKASRRDRTSHRIQVTLYRILVRQLMATNPLMIGGVPLTADRIECVIGRIDESTNKSWVLLEIAPLDLDMEESDIVRLLGPDGALLRILHTDLSDVDYQLNDKCDGCIFNIHCFPETARQRGMELLGIDPSTIRLLRGVGISTIDDLATLDLASSNALAVISDSSFTENLEWLRNEAIARRRTLPGGDAAGNEYEVMSLPSSGRGQLPEHERDGRRLVRIYLSVDYDYVENRLVALSAHVTSSDWRLHTAFEQVPNAETPEDADENIVGALEDPIDVAGRRWQPSADITERREIGRTADEARAYEYRALEGIDVVRLLTSEWTGDFTADTAAEKQLIHDFLGELIDAIAETAQEDSAYIHFYVWSRSELTRLIESCSRVDSRLLGHLRELLGCRESLDQLIYSCLRDEVDSRYGLGWTGRGLAVVTSLRWFGERYHWSRRIGGRDVRLDKVFTQDIFDFKTTLGITSDGNWARSAAETAQRHRFEIRSRFYDQLTVPYWHALWGTLPDPEALGSKLARVARSIRYYNRAVVPGYLRAYLKARVHALRWMEERVTYKNPEITKQLLNVATLRDFSLGVNNVSAGALDFLHLDQHVAVTDWISEHLIPPALRVSQGKTIPVKDVVSLGRVGNNTHLQATIDLERYNVDRATFEAKYALGTFVRLSPCSDDPHIGQTFGQLMYPGVTCKVRSLDWTHGLVDLLTVPFPRADRYRLASIIYPQGPVFSHATLDENPSDFVAARVGRKLIGTRTSPAYQWFDPLNPLIPSLQGPDSALLEDYRELLRDIDVGVSQTLYDDQITAIIDGLCTRVQLLLGPPGTGKTTTTALAVLLRILARRSVGEIVLVAASTHPAVDNLLRRIDRYREQFEQQSECRGFSMPPIDIRKLRFSDDDSSPGGNVGEFTDHRIATNIHAARSGSVLVIGGTTSAVLRMSQDYLRLGAVPVLVIDEASMMVFPHFLALATLVDQAGEIMLTGDHRQLSPIVAHDWEQEDRPPVVLYQPYASAYQAVRNIKENVRSDDSVLQSALRTTYRLPPLIRELIARLYRRFDNVELQGLGRDSGQAISTKGDSGWAKVWDGPSGLYLVLHSERQSKRSNEFEARVIASILEAAEDLPHKSVAVITPHRAQRSMLTTHLEHFNQPVDVIDTVERLQGDERPTVIVSATASDPTAISDSEEFILNLNRSNVAFSRAKDRLIVVCSDTLLNHIPGEVDQYESALLWKSLRESCSELVATESIDGQKVQIFTHPVSYE